MREHDGAGRGRLQGRREFLKRTGLGGMGLFATGPIAAFLSACGGDSNGATAGTSGGAASLGRPLRMHQDAANGPLFAPFLRTFDKQYAPLTVEGSYVAQDYAATTQTQLAGGSVDYDVLFADEGFAEKWYDAGWLRGLDDLDGIDDVLAAMKPELLPSLKAQDGRTIVLPYYRAAELFIYNADHLDKIGAKPPESWDEFVEQCRELKARGVVSTPYSPFWTADFDVVWSEFCAEALSDGAQLFDDEMQPVFADDDAARATLERWQLMYREGLVPRDVMTTAYGDLANVFAGGKSSFTMRYGAQLKGFTDPRSSRVARAAKNALTPGSARSTLDRGAFWMMTASTPAPPEAWKLLSFLAARDKQGAFTVPEGLVTGLGLQTPFPEVNRSPAVRREWARWCDVDLLLEQTEKARDLGPVVNQAWYGEYIQKASEILTDALRGSKPPADALGEMADAVRANL